MAGARTMTECEIRGQAFKHPLTLRPPTKTGENEVVTAVEVIKHLRFFLLGPPAPPITLFAFQYGVLCSGLREKLRFSDHAHRKTL